MLNRLFKTVHNANKYTVTAAVALLNFAVAQAQQLPPNVQYEDSETIDPGLGFKVGVPCAIVAVITVVCCCICGGPCPRRARAEENPEQKQGELAAALLEVEQEGNAEPGEQLEGEIQIAYTPDNSDTEEGVELAKPSMSLRL